MAARTPNSRALSQLNPPIRSATSPELKNSSLSPATSAVTTTGKATATMTRILLTVSVVSFTHSLRIALIIVHSPGWRRWGGKRSGLVLLNAGRRLQEGLFERLALRRQLVQHRLGLQGDLPDLFDVEALHVDAVCPMRAVPPTGAAQDLGEGGRLRGADAHPTLGVAVDELGHRTLFDQPSATDDDEVVGHQRDLGEEVAADEDRPSLTSEGDEDVADPADALGVESVGRLVEDQRVRIPEQHPGEPEALAHAERVAAHLAFADAGHPDGLENGVDA